ncbi:MAG: bifunctional sulfate adenylyltransferase/adenylylsulfate kinase [Planctomycetes bacterium]|nr:bifunctional sulfate adenylyltransferase/adenylylsulfate kinase [Planctomycetota bacterium]
MTVLISPHGGMLKERLLDEKEAEMLKKRARDFPSWDLTERQLCDLEMIMNGGFSPLEGFFGKADYNTVVRDMRLSDGTLWPIPVTLDVTEEFASKVATGSSIALRNPEGILIAVLNVSDIWKPDKETEAKFVYGTKDILHPAVEFLLNRANPVYLGGEITGVEMPFHYDFGHLRNTPRELREKFKRQGWHKVVAFQTRNPMHRAHQELTFRAAKLAEANLLIHPVVGMTKPGDIDHYSRVRCYEKLLKHYPEQTTALSLLPLAMRMGGPREALWHAIIRKNYGCTHLIVGRDHAGPGNGSNGKPFYGHYDAQELISKYQGEIGVEMVPFQMMVYVKEKAGYMPVDEVEDRMEVLDISGTEFRRRLQEGLEIPDWFSFSEVVEELRKTHPPRQKQGFTVFFTGLSGSGKSTIANALLVKFLEMGGKAVTLLDGDLVRKHLSSELGFSKEHRDLNILRIGFVAGEITKAGGIAICAPIAPYAATRKRVRDIISPAGGFLEVYVSTPLEICEERDRKGLYAKARAGIIKEFTGISDPYEAPENPELVIDTRQCSPEEAAQMVLLKLEKLGFIR